MSSCALWPAQVVVLISVLLEGSYAERPMIVDYRNDNVLSTIKDQKTCGACWAFTPLELVETLDAIAAKKLQDGYRTAIRPLSVQHLIDCSGLSYTCSGGSVCDSVNYLQVTSYKFVLEGDYNSYSNRKEHCSESKALQRTNISVTGYWCESFLTKEDTLISLIAKQGPVIASVDATAWRDYLGGIIQYNCDAGTTTHAVLIVGYNLTHPIPFYIIRNSWSAQFGDGGYMYIKVGQNLCGIAEKITYLKID